MVEIVFKTQFDAVSVGLVSGVAAAVLTETSSMTNCVLSGDYDAVGAAIPENTFELTLQVLLNFLNLCFLKILSVLLD